MTALEDDTLSLRRVHQWNLPTEASAFLAWLRESGVGGRNDDARVTLFLTYPAAEDMPESLRRELAARGMFRR